MLKRKRLNQWLRRVSLLFASVLLAAVIVSMSLPALQLVAAELHIGGATISITPDEPVALFGQLHTRIARSVESPLTATALALESRDGDNSLDQAILISCDLVNIDEGILQKVRERIKDRLPDFDVKKLVMNATHTHTAPVMREGIYDLPGVGVMRPAAYAEFLSNRVADIAVEAWKSRQMGSVGWGLGHAVVAQNRRSTYADGTAQMYGSTGTTNFRGIEGYEDHGVEVLCFWDKQGKLFATAINIACPAQEAENGSVVNADFWHNVRESLRAKHGQDLLVLAWTGAAGDQSPHLMYRKESEERMRKLRGLTRLEELSRRIVAAWEEAYEAASQERHNDTPFVHQVETIGLPERIITHKEALGFKAKVLSLSNDPKQITYVAWYQDVIDRYEQQQASGSNLYPMEFHAIRLGDIAIVTNDFELFTDFGIQMKARSPALQTFIIQLTGPGSYVPSVRAVRGGGYSAIVESNHIGPEGGQVLTERTVEALHALWPAH